MKNLICCSLGVANQHMTLFSAENDEHWNTGAYRLKTAGASFGGCTMHRKVSVQDMRVFETEEFDLFISALGTTSEQQLTW